MAEVKPDPSVATLIGDVIGSRRVPDRARLHAQLAQAVNATNEAHAPFRPLRITVGDEFQGTFTEVGDALRTAWSLRWALEGRAELRFGLGWGPARVLDSETGVEDGPGWWAARAAVEWVKEEAARAGTRHVRTAYRRADDMAGPDPAGVNAALLCRDHMVGSLSARSRRILAALVKGEAQGTIAEAERISASAVSQRVRGDGLAVIRAAQDLLEGVTQ